MRAYSSRGDRHRVALIAIEQRVAGAVGVNVDEPGAMLHPLGSGRSLGPSAARIASMRPSSTAMRPKVDVPSPRAMKRRTENELTMPSPTSGSARVPRRDAAP